MAVISVIGTSGIGTTFLVRQLASHECSPAFLEGEEGTIPEEIFRSVFNNEPPQKRCSWYVNKYIKNFEKAIKISKMGIDCFVDGAPITVYANIFLESDEYKKDLMKIAKKVDKFKFDKIILLTINKDKLKELIRKRGRKEEDIDKTVARSLRLQKELIKLAQKRDNVITIDRSDLDFIREEDVELILNKLK